MNISNLEPLLILTIAFLHITTLKYESINSGYTTPNEYFEQADLQHAVGDIANHIEGIVYYAKRLKTTI